MLLKSLRKIQKHLGQLNDTEQGRVYRNHVGKIDAGRRTGMALAVSDRPESQKTDGQGRCTHFSADGGVEAILAGFLRFQNLTVHGPVSESLTRFLTGSSQFCQSTR